MYLVYFDESGDSGLTNSPSQYFALAGVIAHEDYWLILLNDLIDFRRYLKSTYGLPMRVELRANSLIHKKKEFRALSISRKDRLMIFQEALKFLHTHSELLQVFAIVIDKGKVKKKGIDIRTLAWEYALQRVQNTLESFSDGLVEEHAVIFPDEGHHFLIRKLIRKMRRHNYVPSFYGGASRKILTERIIEDPNDRLSHESYLIQLADLSAYAAARHVFPIQLVNATYWDLVGAARMTAVNRLRGGPPGIVLWPK